MQQFEFIYVAHNLKLEPIQDEIGNTIIDLKPDKIRLFHNYKARDRMQIRFKEDGAMFIIPGRKELEHIYGIFMSNSDCVQLIREYCESTLVKQT